MRSLIIVLAFLLAPGIASSTPFLYAVDSGILAASSTVAVVVRASDGFTQDQDGISGTKWTEFAGSSFTAIAEETGVLNPVLAINELQLRTGEISIAGALGSSSLPFVLTIDEIVVTAIGTPLGAPQGIGSNGSVTLSGEKRIAFSGRLESLGETLNFSFNIPLGTPGSGSGFLNINAEWGGGDPFTIKQIDVGSGNRFQPGYKEIGSTSGVLWSVNVQATFLEETLLPVSPVPEPGTAVLMGLGLLGLSIRKRRDG